jgi:hypothetical protein
MTPEEAWSHVNPNVSSFRVFGIVVWELIPNEKCKDMENKSQPLVFFGYCEDMNSCRLFDPITNDVLFCRVVCFDEHFNHSSRPPLSIDWHDGIDHADSLVFEEQEDEETHLVENQPTTVEHLAQEQLDQEQQLRRSLRE